MPDRHFMRRPEGARLLVRAPALGRAPHLMPRSKNGSRRSGNPPMSRYDLSRPDNPSQKRPFVLRLGAAAVRQNGRNVGIELARHCWRELALAWRLSTISAFHNRCRKLRNFRIGDELSTIVTTIPEACQRKSPRRFLAMRLSHSSFPP